MRWNTSTGDSRPRAWPGQAMNDAIEENIDIEHILQEASARWDGGYVITGLLGSGDLFAFRDPHGIRPAFYYASDEVIVVASERPVIQTVFDLPVTEVKELMPGQSIVVKRNGNMKVSTIHPAVEVTPCSFERIYFSRGSDCDIYNERKELGRLLTENILKSVGYDVDHTIFSLSLIRQKSLIRDDAGLGSLVGPAEE